MNVARLLIVVPLTFASPLQAGDPWPMHVIDSGSRGADGVRLADVNQDGRLDIATGWEEGGRIRVCLQPDATRIAQPWPAVVVGKVKSPEDAVFADVNGDQWLDVVSCCEGAQQAIFFHRNPGASQLTQSGKWKTEVLQGSEGATRWMYCTPLSDRRLVFGSKQPNAQISLWSAATKKFQKLRDCGWIMSLRCVDVDHDGDLDVVYSDRKEKACGVGWLQNPGKQNAGAEWDDHPIGGQGLEVMFLDVDESQKRLRIACDVREGFVLLMTQPEDATAPWGVQKIRHEQKTGSGKAAAFCDVNQDGLTDIVCTCGKSERKIGVYWLQNPGTDAQGQEPPDDTNWALHDISGTEKGIKFDRIECIDLDGDGDQDIITCEERDNLGVIWYENPLR